MKTLRYLWFSLTRPKHQNHNNVCEGCNNLRGPIQLKTRHWDSQGRREPNVGPGPAQICQISGFVKSKIYEKKAAVWSEKRCDLKKKKVFTEIETVFPAKLRRSPKKKVFTVTKTNDLPEANGPPKHHGPRVIVPPAPPRGGPGDSSVSNWPTLQCVQVIENRTKL